MIRQRKRLGNRPKAFWGSLIPSLINSVANVASGIITTSAQARAQKRALEQQEQLAQQQAQISRDNQLANTLNNSASADESYANSDQYNLKYRNGGTKRIGDNNIVITDGGNAKRIGRNTYLLRGGSHETINSTGQTGIGINVGGNEIEAEGGEVAQKKGNTLRIFSKQPMFNGISPAQAVKAGANKDDVFAAQQRFKKRNGLTDDGGKYKWGTEDYINAAKIVGSYLPVVGTLEDAYELYQNPSWKQAAWTGLGLASDIFGGRAIVKGLKAARSANKAYKTSKNIINARKMINARNYKNKQIVYGTMTPGIDNVVQRQIVEPLKKRYGGSTSKDKGSFKHSYPRITLYEEPVDYPEPTKDELINALSAGGVPGTDSYKPRRYKGGVDSESPLALLNILHYLDIASGMTDENGNSKYITGVAPSAGRAVNMGRTLANVEKGIQATNKLANTIRNSRNIVTTKPISTSNLGLPEVPTPRSYKDYFKGLGININKATRASKPYNGYARSLEASKPYTPYSGAVISQPITPNPYTGRLEFGSRIDRLNSAFARLRQSGKSIKNKVTNPNTYRTATTAERVRDANGRLVWKQNYKLKPWVKGALGTAGVGAGAGLVYGLSKVENKDSKLKTQLDAHGQPISSYIARPQEPVRQQSKPQTNRSVPVRRDTVRTDTTKQVNKVVPRQTKNISQYKGNTTKGNYQLYDGETKVINGTKYTRKGNTIINHKTNVGYIYDKNGNYTGQADYSKVGNFNQAFDSARAAGRNNFIYRAGKYQNYSTVKETDVKKEALNRRIGAKRIAKRFGDSLPVEGMRPKAVNGTWARPYKYSYEDTNNNAFLNKVKSNGLLYKSNSVTSANTPYLGRQSEFKPATQDYIGLGIDTLAALGSGLFTRSAYNNLDFDYSLPNYVDETPVSFDTTYHNEAQRANIERNRINARNIIGGNTASAQDALTRMQQSDTNALMESNKLLDEKSNKEVELRNQNAANEQAVRARNAAARNQYYQNVATIKNAALQAKNEASLAKAQSVASDLSGLSQAWTNFATSVENRYNNRQNEAIIAATSKEPAVLSNAIQFGYNFSPEILANVYKNTNDDKLKRLALSRLSNSERRKFGII